MTILYNVDFSGSIFRSNDTKLNMFYNFTCVDSRMRHCDFTGCVLQFCKFVNVNFEFSEFCRCLFVDCLFLKCNFDHCDFRFSKFEDTVKFEDCVNVADQIIFYTNKIK